MLAVAALAACAGGCATFPGLDGEHATLDDEIQKRLDEFCPLPDPKTPEKRLLRAQIGLAAIAGYGVRSIQSYSLPKEAGDDARRLIGRINDAQASIGEAQAKIGQYLFPVYRVDMQIEIAEAAAAALRPTLREARGLVLAGGLDRIRRAKSAYLNLLADTLYLEAFKESCGLLKAGPAPGGEMNSAKDRLKLRCGNLAALAGGGATCSIP